MKRLLLGLAGAVIVVAFPATGMATEVNVNVAVQPSAVGFAEEAPPPLEVRNPEMVVVPSGNSYVYMAPNVYGVYFHNGFWFRYYNGVWYRSTVYNRGWVMVRPAVVPRVVIGIYPEYALYLPAGYFRIGWGDFHNHWRDWGHRHYWHNQPWFKREMRPDVRRDRYNHIHRERQGWNSGAGNKPHGYYGGPHKAGPVHKTGPGPIHKTAPLKAGQVHKTAPHGGPGPVHKTAPPKAGPVHKTAPHGEPDFHK
jgi:hypothetical protein